ncbi:hypothetical protein FRB94_008330 [Tulasnella sp. JGI-2019a]|nr:hypothetical protein FRB93_007025 [Tulasnella sp. JGI-2019a]KAG9011499.1 hypothetical protein FRB94_008330 [Tulasnella sp. JGI-2019a]
MSSYGATATNGSPTMPPPTQRKAVLGFMRRQSLYLWLFFGGLTLLFTVAHLEYPSPKGMRKRLVPGEWFWYQQKYYQLGMQLHLMAIFPASVLFVFQFVPYIRNNYRQIHRLSLSGRIAFTLLYIGNIGGIIIAPHAFGGSPSVQSATYTLAILTSFASYKAWRSIRLQRVTEHRKWALRCAFYMGSIITSRPMLGITSLIAVNSGPQYVIFRCDELDFTMSMDEVWTNTSHTPLQVKYPACGDKRSSWPTTVVPVRSAFTGGYEELASAFRLTFGAAMWICLTLHAVGVECYLNLSPPNKPPSQSSGPIVDDMTKTTAHATIS